jgi:hypothetical protein
MVQPKSGRVLWLVDPTAAGMLRPQTKTAL